MKVAFASLIIFSVIFGAGFLGTLVRRRLPEHHLTTETKDTVKLAMGLVATMTALVLGLLVASTKGTYDSEKAGIIAMSAKVVMLDRMLAHYGPEAKPARDLLLASVQQTISHLWPDSRSQPAQLDPSAAAGDTLYDVIQELNPQTESQRLHKSMALSSAVDLGQARWLLYEETGSSISKPLLAIVVCWLAILLFSFGLFAPRNHTALIAIFVCSLCVSAAIFLIMELDRPFGGLIHISGRSMQVALQHLGK